MAKTCKVTVNNETFVANCGDLLLDGAMMNGIDLPHDCRSGICGACRVRLVGGTVFGGHSRGDDMIHACQARIVSDLEIAIEAAPEPVALSAEVAPTVQLAPDVVGVDLEQPQREMVFIVQARSIRSLYMHAALCRLALFPNVTLIPMVSEPQQISHAVRSGRPTDHLPKLSPDDVVYTAGAPAMTDAVARI